jgi:DNA-directed RNA polymerase specialized sigma24 family protein
MMDERTDILRRCAWRASRGLSPGLTRDDLLQEGRLALWLAERDGRVPTDPKHAHAYLARRALGAMQDANRCAWRQQPPTVGELTPDTPTREACEQPDTIAQMRQVIARIATHGSEQLKRCVELLCTGADPQDAARALHVSESRISQLRAQARSIASHCL